MKKRPRRQVYVVGAGFSAALGYPVTDNLLTRFWARIDDPQFRSQLKGVIKFHNPRFDCREPDSFPNVEELISQMDVNEKLFKASRQYEGNFTEGDLTSLQRTMLLKISDWFHDISKNLHLSEPSVQWLYTFRDHVRRHNIGIISFNWDLVLEKLLFGKTLNQESYGFPLEPFKRPTLIKPHGSLNWFRDDCGQHIVNDKRFLLSGTGRHSVHVFRRFRAPKSSFGRKYTPLVVPPVYLKNFDQPVFRTLWQNCTRLLSTAERVVFIGYSIPAADFHAHFIMRCGFQNQIDGELVRGGRRNSPTGPAEVVVVNPGPKVAERVATIAGPNHRCRPIPAQVEEIIWDGL